MEKPEKEKKSHSLLKVALVGNPNCGKTTLFNSLTGLNQKVGNFAGVTVDKKIGLCEINSSKQVQIIDLPGTYSLKSSSLDEQLTAAVICDSKSEDFPDITLVIVDACNLKRNLFLASQVIDLGRPCILVLNMIDEAESKNIKIDLTKFSTALGIKVFPTVARSGKGINAIKQALELPSENFLPDKSFFDESTLSESNKRPNQLILNRYKKINELLDSSVSFGNTDLKNTLTYRLDRVLTHKYWGFLIFLLVLFFIFQFVFSVSSYPMDLIESAFLGLGEIAGSCLPSGLIRDLLVNGIISGLSGVVIFIPQIAFLFAFIAVLEDSGYMARVSFIMDRLMRKFGLNGKSLIPLISGTACAVPAIMASRTIGNWKERIITILVTPLMSCSARLPVYTLLISLVIPKNNIGGFINIQGLTLLALYLLGFIAALFSALLFKLLIRSNQKSYFILELPLYRAPRWKNIGITIIEKVKFFVFDAGKIIVAVSIILWVLCSYAPGNSFDKIDKKYQAESAIINEDLQVKIAAEKLESSYAGLLGKAIEPVIEPLGFDWKIGIALVTSFVAREVFVGTMATIYSVSDPENNDSIKDKMASEKKIGSNKLKYDFACGISLMLFYAFAMQCISTIAIVYKETNSIKWPVLQFIYLGVLAYFSSYIAYSILS